ncbi:conserved domain protein [Actinomyces sp. oral taxon 170 str. F0386]|nr:conserved domain protein [Actinomyces sp. oral taxon 170 str. F0386]
MMICVPVCGAGVDQSSTSRSYLMSRVRGVEGTNARHKVRTQGAPSCSRNRP